MSRARLIIALLIVLIVPPSVHIGPFFGIVHEAQAATTSIKLYAFYYGWNLTKPSRANPTITVTQGDTISFNLINNDTIAHLFLLDYRIIVDEVKRDGVSLRDSDCGIRPRRFSEVPPIVEGIKFDACSCSLSFMDYPKKWADVHRRRDDEYN